MYIFKERFVSYNTKKHNTNTNTTTTPNNNNTNNNVNNRVGLCLRVLIYCLILDHQAIIMSNANSVNHRHKNHHHNHNKQHQLSHNNQNQNQNQHQNGRLKEIFLVKKNPEHTGILHWNGEMESSCSFISTIKELKNSKECRTNNNNEDDNDSPNSHSHSGYQKDDNGNKNSDDDDDFFKDSEEETPKRKRKRNVEESLSTILSEKVQVNTDGMWIPCGARESCSVVYQVEKGWKIKQLFISGVVDRRAEIFVLAQYLTEKGKNYQLRRLRHEHGMNDRHRHQSSAHNKHGHHHQKQNKNKKKNEKDEDVDYINDGDAPENVNKIDEPEFKRKEFSFFHEGFLYVSTLNVTAVLNGGFSLIDNITLILERDYDLVDSVAQPPPPQQELEVRNQRGESVVLDVKEDEEKTEWIDISCNYRDLYEEFWIYGCPVSSGIKYDPENVGIWSPCHKTSCSFFYDGSSHNQFQSIVVDGYFHGASVFLSGKSHPLEDHFQLIDSRHYHNSTVLQIFFDLSNVCNVSVLQISVSSTSDDSTLDSTILIDKINIQHKPGLKSQTSCNQISGVVENARAMKSRNSLNSGGGIGNSKNNMAMLLHISCNVFILVLVTKLFTI